MVFIILKTLFQHEAHEETKIIRLHKSGVHQQKDAAHFSGNLLFCFVTFVLFVFQLWFLGLLNGIFMKRYFWIWLFAGMANGIAYAGGPISLNGDLVISKEPLTDPLPDGDPAAYMTLRGKDAREVYDGIKSSDYQSACGVDGVTARVAGNLICYKNKSDNYWCSFGIRLTDGALVLGKPC